MNNTFYICYRLKKKAKINMSLLSIITKIINPKPNQIVPHRWAKKDDVEKWILNYHPDPGYPNQLKQEWKTKQK